MTNETKGWLVYLVIIFEARAIQLRNSKGEWAGDAHSHAAAYDKAVQIMMLGLKTGKLPKPQELTDIFGQGFPPIAERMLDTVLAEAAT